jgi:predicted DNA-binding transcriptional regulator AlpA
MLLFSNLSRVHIKSILRAQAVASLPHASRQAIAQAYTSQARFPKPISLVSTRSAKALAQSSFRSAVYQSSPSTFFVTVAA